MVVDDVSTSVVGWRKELKSKVSVVDAEGRETVSTGGAGAELKPLKLETATTCLSTFSRMATRSERALFSESRRSSSDEGTDVAGSCLTATLEGGGATEDRLTPELTMAGGMPSSPARLRTVCSGVEWRNSEGARRGVVVSTSPRSLLFSSSSCLTRTSISARCSFRWLRERCADSRLRMT